LITVARSRQVDPAHHFRDGAASSSNHRRKQTVPRSPRGEPINPALWECHRCVDGNGGSRSDARRLEHPGRLFFRFVAVSPTRFSNAAWAGHKPSATSDFEQLCPHRQLPVVRSMPFDPVPGTVRDRARNGWAVFCRRLEQRAETAVPGSPTRRPARNGRRSGDSRQPGDRR
jgi:hypothetical protein